MKYFAKLVVLAVALQMPLAAVAQMRPPIPMTQAQFARAVPGQNVTIAVRVDSVTRTDVRAQLLERINDTLYANTKRNVRLFVADGTPVVMGSAEDVKPGAVLFVYGVSTARDRADAKRLVAVTQYVTVK